MVETVLIILVFLFLVLGMIDLGVGVFRYHQVSWAARQGVRLAIVHGELAPPVMKQWGPATIDVPAVPAGVEIVSGLQPYLIGLDKDKTRIIAEWLDASTALEQRVRVTVTTPYQPIVTFLFGNPTYTLSASSTIQIAH